MGVDIEFKNEVWSYGFPTILINLDHARKFVADFKGALRFKYAGVWYSAKNK
jgi:hypothetical protein